MHELVVLHVAMSRQQILLGCLPHTVAHVRDQVHQQEVTGRQHVLELLGDPIEPRQLVLDGDLSLDLEARLMNHGE